MHFSSLDYRFIFPFIIRNGIYKIGCTQNTGLKIHLLSQDFRHLFAHHLAFVVFDDQKSGNDILAVHDTDFKSTVMPLNDLQS